METVSTPLFPGLRALYGAKGRRSISQWRIAPKKEVSHGDYQHSIQAD